MSMNRSMAASYGITLLMFACDGGGGPMRAVSNSEVQTSPPDSESLDNEEVDEEAEDDARETVPEPEAEEPDAIGLPCDVKAVFLARCQGCHGVDAKNGTPLLTRDNLIALSKKDPTMTVIERVLLRVTAVDKPMPPVGKGEPLTEDELATLRNWSELGSQAARCDE
jgi:mono/diheme cytochrome c family protein